MAQREDHLVDRLAERGLVDRWGFLLFALGGAAAILVAKAFGVAAIIVAAGAAITMVLYAAIVQTAGTGRLRADQAGDNCYYLGLIYTLTSLAYAIFFFDPADTATTIVQGFGVALATTIMGIVLRVFFNQSRVDLVQTEDTARIELAEAAGRLKAELAATVVSMNDFGRRTRQSLEELSGEVLRTLGEVQAAATKAVTEASEQTTTSIREAGEQAVRSVADMAGHASSAISDTAAQATQAVSEQTSEAVARARRLSNATEKVVAGIEKHAGVLGEVERSTSGIMAGLAALESAATATRGSMEALGVRAGRIDEAEAGVGAAGRDLRDAASQLLGHMQKFDGAAERFDTLVGARLEQVKSVPEEVGVRSRQAVEAAIEALRSSVTELTGAQSHGAAAIARHNDALEAELTRSRDNVAKVHSALVEITGNLAAQVETLNA